MLGEKANETGTDGIMSIHIGLIYGSTREGRFCDKVAEWAISEIAKHGEFAGTQALR